MGNILRKLKSWVRDPDQRDFYFFLLIANIVGTIYGYYWYKEQFAATPLYFWPFLPDCPLATNLFSIMMFLRLKGKKVVWFETIALIALLKYGIWTDTVIGLHWLTGGIPTVEQFALVFGHTGMVIEALIFLRFLPWQRWAVILNIGIMVLYDFIDYTFAVYPWLPNVTHLPFVRAFTIGETLVITAVTLWLAFRRKEERDETISPVRP